MLLGWERGMWVYVCTCLPGLCVFSPLIIMIRFSVISFFHLTCVLYCAKNTSSFSMILCVYFVLMYPCLSEVKRGAVMVPVMCDILSLYLMVLGIITHL